jgi:WHEP-TRS domain
MRHKLAVCPQICECILPARLTSFLCHFTPDLRVAATMSTAEELTQLIEQKASAIRDLKAAGGSGEPLKAMIDGLLALKEQYKEVAGKPFDPPKAVKFKKEAAAKPAAAAADAEPAGPSKKDLAKAAKKAAKDAAKAAAKVIYKFFFVLVVVTIF